LKYFNKNKFYSLRSGFTVLIFILFFIQLNILPVAGQEKPDEKTGTEKVQEDNRADKTSEGEAQNQETAESRTSEENADGAEEAEKESLWTFIVRGGITMVGLAIISTIIIAFIIERALFFKSQKVKTKGFYEMLTKTLKEGGLDDLDKKLSEDSSLIARVLYSGLHERQKGRERMVRAIENNSSIELGKLEKGLNFLNNLGNLAPLLGFFGTVTGMRHSFLEFVLKAAPTASDLAGGVEEALITTIAGLFIAIPTYLVYNLFIYYIDNLTIEIERCANTIMDKID